MAAKQQNRHENTDTGKTDDEANVKKHIKTEINQRSDKVIPNPTDCVTEAEDRDKEINDTEKKEIDALDKQREQLRNEIDKEVARKKKIIHEFYQDLRLKNSDRKKKLTLALIQYCTEKNDAAQKIDKRTGKNIKTTGLEPLSAAMAEFKQTPMIRMDTCMFSPGEIKVNKLEKLIGMLRESTEFTPEEREKKERIDKQIQSHREVYTKKTVSDEDLKTRMCTKCQGWTGNVSCGFRCQCG